jgi:hypothetical protein
MTGCVAALNRPFHNFATGWSPNGQRLNWQNSQPLRTRAVLFLQSGDRRLNRSFAEFPIFTHPRPPRKDNSPPEKRGHCAARRKRL